MNTIPHTLAADRQEILLHSGWTMTKGVLKKQVPNHPYWYWITKYPYSEGVTIDQHGRERDRSPLPWKPEHMPG